MIFKQKDIETQPGLVIWDIDGTITYHDTLRAHYFRVLSELGIEMTDGHFAEICASVNDFFDSLRLRHTKLTFDEYCRYIEEHLSFLKDNPKIKGIDFIEKGREIEPLYLYLSPGMDELIKGIASTGISQVAYTNWFLEIQQMKLNKFNLLPYFDDIYTPETLEIKPIPNGFRQVLEITGKVAEDTIMIGDSISDMGARKVGIHTILFDPLKKKLDLYLLADSVVTNPDDLRRLILKK